MSRIIVRSETFQTTLVYIPLSAQRHGSRELFVITVEPRLSDIRLTDLPGYPTYHTEPSTPRYPTKIG